MCDQQREKDIQTVIQVVLKEGIQWEYNDTGADQYRCMFCYSSVEDYSKNGRDDIEHDLDCPYLIAKDLNAGYKRK